MKKFLALALTLTLVLALSISVSAVRVVGKEGQTPAINNGVPANEFGSGTVPSTTISVSVNAEQVQSRYAVDVEFDPITFSIGSGVLTWDVNDYVYVQTGEITDLNQDYFIKVINHSDKSINIATTVDKPVADATDGVQITVSGATTVARTEAGATEAKFDNVKVTIVADMDKAADYYASALSVTPTVEIATVTLTISK